MLKGSTTLCGHAACSRLCASSPGSPPCGLGGVQAGVGFPEVTYHAGSSLHQAVCIVSRCVCAWVQADCSLLEQAGVLAAAFVGLCEM